MFRPSIIELNMIERVQPTDFLDTFNRNCINDEVDEINTIFTSDRKDMTFSHYKAQPKSMFCRKLVRNSIEGNFEVFDHKWLPKCFRHANLDSSSHIFYECKNINIF